MRQINTYSPDDRPTESVKRSIVKFLHEQLGKYGDPQDQITKALNYALGENGAPGGTVLELIEDDVLKGAVILNKTGMSGYIPENILVYIATHSDYRGTGLGTELMKKAIEKTKGDIALHVDADNPAKGLYEKLGFTNPYLEMRLKK